MSQYRYICCIDCQILEKCCFLVLYHFLLSKEEMVRITLGVRTRRMLGSADYAGGAILACSKQEKKKSKIYLASADCSAGSAG